MDALGIYLILGGAVWFAVVVIVAACCGPDDDDDGDDTDVYEQPVALTVADDTAEYLDARDRRLMAEAMDRR